VRPPVTVTPEAATRHTSTPQEEPPSILGKGPVGIHCTHDLELSFVAEADHQFQFICVALGILHGAVAVVYDMLGAAGHTLADTDARPLVEFQEENSTTAAADRLGEVCHRIGGLPAVGD